MSKYQTMFEEWQIQSENDLREFIREDYFDGKGFYPNEVELSDLIAEYSEDLREILNTQG